MTVQRLNRIAFIKDVPSPIADSFSKTHWNSVFLDGLFLIAKDGEDISITHVETARTFHYPLSTVAAYEIARFLPRPASISVPTIGKKPK